MVFFIMKNQISSILSQIPNYNSKKYLLAVSGGIDSMVLMNLFHQLELDFAVAHCNFNLRAEESKLDEKLVKKGSEEYGKTCFVKQFDVNTYKEENGVSTQMAARELRYDWFENLRNENKFDYIVTAHHLDDNIETFFLNLARGTGIDGITGMKIINGFLLRPLLNIEKSELLTFAESNKLEWREDESNKSNNYKRNKIRNQIIPLFKDLNPSFANSMKENFSRFNSVNEIYKKTIQTDWNNSVINKEEGNYQLEIEKVLNFSNPTLYLFEFLKKFEFDFNQCQQIISVLDTEHSSGKRFHSKGFTVLIDREIMMLSSREKNEKSFQLINKFDSNVTYPLNLSLKKLAVEEFEINSNPNCVYLDIEKLKFPLTIRNWEEGDCFRPLGMKGKKKVSDFLIDNKISLFEKEKTFVLISKDEVCWVIGYRISDTYKVTSSTKSVLKLTLE